jgi:S-adenosylmethionine-diacylglycerol 3-amino-3-carboxypropyl transferase
MGWTANLTHDTNSAPRRGTGLADRVHGRLFEACLSRALVYNTCWEDPAVDRQALQIAPADRMLVITSAGCNVLDYALTGPSEIHAVDANPRQNALLELKLAGIRRLDFADFFRIFGEGRHPAFREIYADQLRDGLSDFAREYWDRHGHWFCPSGARDSFYFRGLSGLVARAFRAYLGFQPALRDALDALFQAASLDEQRAIYHAHVAPRLWTGPVRWALSSQLTMTLLGVPHPQRREVESQHAGGVAAYVREAVEYVACRLPLRRNYFWSLYFRGTYTAGCCPEYLRPENFLALKRGLADRIVVHTCTVTDFLRRNEAQISAFVLLDHQDWLGAYQPRALAEEWDAVLARASAGARIIFRSAHAQPAYLAAVDVRAGDRRRPLLEALRFQPELARRLQREDRVQTYAGFHIALADG